MSVGIHVALVSIELLYEKGGGKNNLFPVGLIPSACSQSSAPCKGSTLAFGTIFKGLSNCQVCVSAT